MLAGSGDREAGERRACPFGPLPAFPGQGCPPAGPWWHPSQGVAEEGQNEQ